MQQNSVYVFDLDGVITNPQNSAVDGTAVEHIYNLLQNDVYVAINTGRSYAWVDEHLVGTLRDLGAQTYFDHLYVVCEKGGESLSWDGVDFSPQPSRFALSKQDIASCRQVFDDNQDLLSTMFWDDTKQTMATIEKLPQADLQEFHAQQTILVDKLANAFDGQDVRVDGTTIATDVELPSAGKHAGAELIFEWVATHSDTQNSSFVCFGDSKSDYEMARYFASQGNQTTFVFVGKKEDEIAEHDGVLLVRTNAMYAEGTREYFANPL